MTVFWVPVSKHREGADIWPSMTAWMFTLDMGIRTADALSHWQGPYDATPFVRQRSP